MSHAPDPSSSRDRGSRLAAWLSFVLVTVFGLALLWPVPSGHMPMSADHTVHLTRIFLTAEQLSHGHLAGWSSTWFFGFPVGELYPQLGDLAVIAVHGVGLGLLDWWQSYALGFTLVFLVQGWAMLRAGRAFGLGLAPGLIAALLLLADPGMYREGGWMYTVGFGVWPQALATALSWWGFAELALSWRKLPGSPRPDSRGLARAALVLGASLLAHPMALPMIAMGMPLFVLCMGLRGGGLRRHLGAAAVASMLALMLASYWLVPMLHYRNWMASYGWLFTSLENMTQRALAGHLTGRMPPATGYLAAAGLLWAALAGRGFARFVAAFALVSWLFAASDVWWTFRLDRISEGFSHIQYQRFLLAAKPGLYLAAGAAVGAAVTFTRRIVDGSWRPSLAPRHRGASALAVASLTIAGIGWTTVDTSRAMREYHVGEIQLARRPGGAEFEATFETDYQAFLAWAHDQRSESDGFYRIAIRADRNEHWFMDSPVVTQTATYKLGFTPGDNFVHKPESGRPALLDRLRVRYMVRPGRNGARARDEVARFGGIAVVERPIVAQVAFIDDGQLEVIEDDVDAGRVRVRVRRSAPGARLTFNVAGYPRWQVSRDGEPVEWVEVPVLGDAAPASQADRRAGLLRGGKADGDDGTEPALIAVLDAGDGEYLLEYRYRRWFDWLGGLGSLAALLTCGLAAFEFPRAPGPGLALRSLLAGCHTTLVRLSRPALIGALGLTLLLIVGVRWTAAAHDEARFATGWLLEGRAEDVHGMRAAPFKTDMLIRSAVRVRPRRNKTASATFPSVQLGDRLDGWVAIEDDAAKAASEGKHRIQIEVRARDGGDWVELRRLTVRHHPDRVPLNLETKGLAGRVVDVRVNVESSGKSPPPLAFDLELEPIEEDAS